MARGVATITDELTAAADTAFERRQGYTVVRTPACPTYYCGNCLVLDAPPDDPEAWVARFADELPEVAQVHLQWESDAVDVGEGSVHVLGPVAPLERPAPVVARPLDEEDWPALLALSLAVAAEQHPGDDAWIRWRTAAHRAACAEGRARWWGAFDGARLVGSLGLYESPRRARFQEVLTAADARGRGVCTTLVHRVASEVAARRPGEEVVIVADNGSAAERIYRRLGFRPVGTQFELSRPRG